VLRDVESLHGQVILFIDELHLLVGAGGGEGAVDASNMLKPALARGELRCMGATTLDEYRYVLSFCLIYYSHMCALTLWLHIRLTTSITDPPSLSPALPPS